MQKTNIYKAVPNADKTIKEVREEYNAKVNKLVTKLKKVEDKLKKNKLDMNDKGKKQLDQIKALQQSVKKEMEKLSHLQKDIKQNKEEFKVVNQKGLAEEGKLKEFKLKIQDELNYLKNVVKFLAN